MIDITKCTNTDCPKRIFCKRVSAPSNEYQQSYCWFQPKDNNEVNFKCDFFIPIKAREAE